MLANKPFQAVAADGRISWLAALPPRPWNHATGLAPLTGLGFADAAAAERHYRWPDRPVLTVFVVQHVAREDADDEDVKFIGVYSSRPAAEAAVARLLVQPSFREYPMSFHIDEYALDQDHWVEGFG